MNQGSASNRGNEENKYMLKQWIHFCFLVFISLLSDGCAYILTGTTETVTLRSSPNEAWVVLKADTVGRTPTQIFLKRGATERAVQFEREGYNARQDTLRPVLNPWLLLDLLWATSQLVNQGLPSTERQIEAAAIVGIISLGFDFLSGAAYRLRPDTLRTTLAPNDIK